MNKKAANGLISIIFIAIGATCVGYAMNNELWGFAAFCFVLTLTPDTSVEIEDQLKKIAITLEKIEGRRGN